MAGIINEFNNASDEQDKALVFKYITEITEDDDGLITKKNEYAKEGIPIFFKYITSSTIIGTQVMANYFSNDGTDGIYTSSFVNITAQDRIFILDGSEQGFVELDTDTGKYKLIKIGNKSKIVSINTIKNNPNANMGGFEFINNKKYYPKLIFTS